MKKRTLGERGKKQSQTKPNKAKSCPPSVWRIKAKMNVSTFTKRKYEQKTTNYELIKTKPNFEMTKTNANLFVNMVYEKNRDFGFRQNKPKQSQTKPMLVRHQCGGSSRHQDKIL